MARAAAGGVLDPGAHTFTLDSTGLSVERASAYYRWRGGPRPARAFDGGWAQVPVRRRWAKLTCVADVASHLVVGLTVAWGPTQDAPQLLPVLAQTLAQLPAGHWCHTLLADAGFDSERNRAGARALGVRQPVIALNRGGRPDRLPTTPERRRAAQRFPRRRYRQRAHAESVFSALKRTLGATIRARRPDTQLAAAALRVITYNLALLLPRLVPSTEPEGTEGFDHNRSVPSVAPVQCQGTSPPASLYSLLLAQPLLPRPRSSLVPPR